MAQCRTLHHARVPHRVQAQQCSARVVAARPRVASLTGQTGIAIFRVAFERWVNDTGQRDLPELIRES